jgi:hypothetical protein
MDSGEGTLQSVNPVGEGTVDLLLHGNVGVEVKYWTARHLTQNVRSLVEQLHGYQQQGLSRIIEEFMQTSSDPITHTNLNELALDIAQRYGLDLTNIELTIVANGGIP